MRMDIFKGITDLFKSEKDRLAAQANRLFNTDTARKMYRTRTKMKYSRNHYTPHQGAAECERRRLRGDHFTELRNAQKWLLTDQPGEHNAIS